MDQVGYYKHTMEENTVALDFQGASDHWIVPLRFDMHVYMCFIRFLTCYVDYIALTIVYIPVPLKITWADELFRREQQLSSCYARSQSHTSCHLKS